MKQQQKKGIRKVNMENKANAENAENAEGRARRVQRRKSGMVGIITLALVFVLVLGLTIPSMADNSAVQIVLDGKTLTFDSNMGVPFIDKNSRTQVPLNAVLTAFGATVDWNASQRMATAKKDGITVDVPIDQSYIWKDGIKIDNDTVAIIKNQRTYLPISAVMKAFGANVEWKADTRTVAIESREYGAGNHPGQMPIPKPDIKPNQKPSNEMNAMWISYLEFLQMPKSEGSFKAAVDQMMDNCKSYGMNAVIVQVRADSDAMYPSKYFPWSKFAAGTQGTNPGYDPLEYMIQAAHSRNLEFHAWVNPYRVTGYKMSWNEVSADNPAKVWLTDSDKTNDRWVLLQNGFYYYNPAVPEVQELVINGIREIVANYDVDGIHFDDYFYPNVSNSNEALWFDKPEYIASGTTTDISKWRRENVNRLVQGVYQAIKAEDRSVVFGISPAGNVDNLRSNSNYFVDIDRWMSEAGYIDYIMPQIYWGFERKTATGALAPYAYENNLNTWIKLKNMGNVKLYIGLNVGNAGTKVSDNNPVSEWLRYDDILKRQVLAGRATGEVSGYAYFRYGVFETPAAKKEVANLVPIL